VNDTELIARIGQLVDEEHQLEKSHRAGDTSADVAARLQAIEVALDQCWDLLRQRRARRDRGENPDDATIRPASTVEGYQQ
jgi:Protein of unknown function (DUF2630)